GRVDLGIRSGDERGRGSGFHRERGHSVDHLLFQLEQFGSRFDDNAREAKILVRYVVVFESFQLQASHIGAGEDFADGGIDFIEILGEDETLHQTDVGTVLGVQRKALRKDLPQTIVGGGRVLDHRGIRLQQDVDGRDRVWLGIGGARIPSGQGDGTGHHSYEQEVSEVFGSYFHGWFLALLIDWWVDGWLFLEGEDLLPVVLHADRCPALLLRLVIKSLWESADLRVRQTLRRAIGIFALCVVVKHQHAKSRTTAGLGVFEHLLVAGGVAKCRVRAAADHQVDAFGFATVVVVEQQLGVLGQERFAILVMPYVVPPMVPTTCSGGIP